MLNSTAQNQVLPGDNAAPEKSTLREAGNERKKTH
jgi:hypothetical protein